MTLRLHPKAEARAAGIRRWFPEARIGGSSVAFVHRGRPRATDPIRPTQRRPSFYVDYDEPAVAALRPAIVAKLGASPTPEGLAGFVDGWIARKTMGRLLDPASVAAARGEGDCTEHAVLLAAVARLFGRPSRIVHGLAVIEVEGGWTALGHAWTEIHDGTSWRLLDATRPPEGRLLYLPLGVLEDEGPGFATASLRSLNPLDVASVELAPGER